MTFWELKYGTSAVQVVLDTSTYKTMLEVKEGVLKPTVGGFVTVTGQKKALPAGAYSAQDFELHATKVVIHSEASEEYLSKCPPGSAPDVKLRERLAYFRDPEFSTVLQVSAHLCRAFREYFRSAGMTEILPPMMTGTQCEGGATLFKTMHPGRTTKEPVPAYLTQSSQFALEYLVPALGDTWCMAPSFRAEHSTGPRHMTEFWHVEYERAGVFTMEQHVAGLKSMLVGVIERLLVFAETELKTLGQYEYVQTQLEKCRRMRIMTHREAIEELRKRGIEKEPGVPFGDRDDIPEAAERRLIDEIGDVIALVRFPSEFKSFYMALCKDDPSLTESCDIEVPLVGEIIGSGIRKASYDQLLKCLLDAGLDPADYEEYLELRRDGFMMTAGMGLGLGRVLSWLLRRPSIREVTAFPRFPGYLKM